MASSLWWFCGLVLTEARIDAGHRSACNHADFILTYEGRGWQELLKTGEPITVSHIIEEAIQRIKRCTVVAFNFRFQAAQPPGAAQRTTSAGMRFSESNWRNSCRVVWTVLVFPLPAVPRRRRVFNRSIEPTNANTLFEREFTGILDKQKDNISNKRSWLS